MALFQPTNIIPSTLIGQGTVDVNNNMEISWQVNGNSAMTAYQIDFYMNDTASTYVDTTGKIPDGIPTGGFYGTDRFGNPQFFTYNVNVAWEDKGFTNGNEYKFKITQFWSTNDEIYTAFSSSTSLSGNNVFKVEKNSKTIWFMFYLGTTTYNSAAFFFNLTQQKGWIVSSNRVIPVPTKIYNTEPPSTSFATGVLVDSENRYDFVAQNSASIFVTRTTPTLQINQTTDETYSATIPFQNYVKLIVADELAVGSTNYFSFITQNSSGQEVTNYASFIVSDDAIPSGTTIFYNVAENTAYYVNSSNAQTDLGTITVTQAQPATGNNLGVAILSIAASIGYFQAAYNQGQDDAIRWIRWQVAQANNGVVSTILADTGNVYTPTLNFEFNGFFNGQQYAIQCFGESESGQACSSGWQYFTINIENQSEYTGNFTAQCINKENSVLLEWEGIEVIPPNVSPEDYTPTISNGSVALNANSSITWNKQGTNAMSFPTPWTAVWKGKCLPLGTVITTNYIGNVNLSSQSKPYADNVAFSPNGSLCVVTFQGYAYLYRVNGSSFEYLSEIQTNTSTGDSSEFVKFSPNGNILLIGTFNYGIQVFSVNGETISFASRIAGSVSFGDAVFNSSGDRLILITGLGGISLYNVSGTTITLNKTIHASNYGVESIRKLAISPNDNILVAYGYNLNARQQNTAVYFSISGDEYTYVGTINDSDGVSLGQPNTRVASASFSPNGTLLALCGTFSDALNLYSVSSNQITFLKKLTKNGTILTSASSAACQFSQNGEALIYSGSPQFGTMELFLVNEGGVNYDRSFGNIAGNILISPNSEVLLAWTLSSSETLNEYSISYITSTPQIGKFLKIGSDIVGTFNANTVNVDIGTTSVSIEIPNVSQELLLLITPNDVIGTFYDATNAVIKQTVKQVSYAQQNLPSVTIYGGDNGTIVSSVSVYDVENSSVNILSLYQNNPDFEPVWNSNQYSLYMTANFNGNLEGGTGTASGKGFQIYRQEVGTTVLTPIATVSSTTTSLKDYGIVSRKAYQYTLYAYDNNGAFMSAVEAENTIATNFKNYSLLVCDYDQTNDEYHVRKQYLFALNLTDGSVGNNNSPTLNANFTAYPTRMPSTQNYASGTLSGLIGAIYTVPALIEQIGQYKYTAKPSTMDYFDSVDLEQELYGLSVAPYQLFLRDMKGRLRMIATSAPITMTTNIKQLQQSITISLPWVEVGDASDVTIIQTPDDYGWNNDNQVFDVQLDVDVATGELSAQYPFPYNGTKFYLTGVNKETLTAQTPLGVTPAQFDLSDTASQPDDGELTATVTVNSEENQ